MIALRRFTYGPRRLALHSSAALRGLDIVGQEGRVYVVVLCGARKTSVLVERRRYPRRDARWGARDAHYLSLPPRLPEAAALRTCVALMA